MISFASYLAETTGARKIVMLYATHDTNQRMVTWCLKNGFNLASTFGGRKIEPHDFEFHVTLVASKNAISLPETDHLIEPVRLIPNGFETLGEKKNIPTLRFKPVPVLTTKRDFLISTYGIDPTFDNFKPHMSLSYSWSGTPSLDKLKPPTFPIVLHRWIVKEFQE